MADDFDTAFPTLTEADLAVLDELGTRRPVAAGEYLFREGDVTYDFNVVVSGAIEIVSHDGTEEQIVAEHGPGKFIGELNLLTGMRVFVSARAVEPGEVIVVPRDALRRLIATDPGLGDTILIALMARRAVLLERRVGQHPDHRVPLLSGLPGPARVRGAFRHPLRVARPRQRLRPSRPCCSSSASTPASCPSSSRQGRSCADPLPARWPSTWA